MNKKKLLVRGPVLSQSGYGEQARFALRSLRTREDIFELFILPTGWGQSGWMSVETEERRWADKLIHKTAAFIQEAQNQGIPAENLFDISLQITIPNEWSYLAPINIGYTAGIETTKVAPEWLQKSKLMDKIIVVSEHSKEIFEKSVYSGPHPTNPELIATLKNETPIDVVHYGVRKENPKSVDLDLEYEFNFLCMCQWGPRKNLENTIKWFVEENFDREVGLIVKTSLKNNSIIDRAHVERSLENMLNQFEDYKCKIYLLHGDMTPEELAGLYTHPKIKAMLTATHGEGFGLPLFEAACHAMPVIAPGWSGQKDFLYMPDNRRKNNTKTKPMFSSIEYDLKPVQEKAHWKGVIQPDSQWCFPRESSFKRRIREAITKYPQLKKRANKLQKWILKEFSEADQYDAFCAAVIENQEIPSEFYDDALKNVTIKTLTL